MIPLSRALTAYGLVVALAACSLVGPRGDDPMVAYPSAEERALLEVPPDVSGSLRQSLLRLPEGGKSAITHSTLLPDPESVRLVRDGRLRWLEADANARELWPSLKDFFTQSGFAIARDEPLLGLIETQWRDVADSRASQGGVAKLFSTASSDARERFRLRLERIDGSETRVRVFLTQRRMEQTLAEEVGSRQVGDFYYARRPPDAERETEMMLRLLVYLGVKEQIARGVLTLQQAQQLAARAYLDEVDGRPSLVIADTFPRVWIRTGEALEDIGLEIEQTLKTEFRYEVLFSGALPENVQARMPQTAAADEDSGFFSTLFGGDDEVEQYYQVYVREEPGQTRISIADTTGSSKLPALEQEILRRLYQEFR